MLVKRTSKNQVTLPESVIQSVGEADCFDACAEDGRIVLTPIRLEQARQVREKLAALGIKQQDIEDAIKRARQK